MSSHAASAPSSDLSSGRWNPECLSQAVSNWGRAALVVLGIVLAGTIGELVHLREDRSFWLSGDSPARLRSFVCEMFYPLVCLQMVLLLRMTWTLFATGLSSPPFWLAEAAIVLLLWGTLGFSLLFAVENNVANLLEGRPLHWHPEEIASYSARHIGG